MRHTLISNVRAIDSKTLMTSLKQKRATKTQTHRKHYWGNTRVRLLEARSSSGRPQSAFPKL